MAVVKKTVSISEDIYREAVGFSKNFSQTINQALKEFIKKKKREKLLSLAGSWEDFEEDGVEFVNRIREENKKASARRMKNWDT
ncbi:protein containing DUF217 [Candidatus Desulfofervidus auxilii]|uniref:Protein containing DUF217 n=1 Tax=Desulfofervidus auxilii TaxID=1621989 RepID=A0A7U4QIC1_DESA2|nr:type II toxin-antitoxin system CcdA family antitoxin [Candidatus Desulfofervidus auxilii]AMM39908.1 protein containing DUF217 [Candidatus Desulfofervidus auxilii]